jgi:hypothetical protein
MVHLMKTFTTKNFAKNAKIQKTVFNDFKNTFINKF